MNRVWDRQGRERSRVALAVAAATLGLGLSTSLALADLGVGVGGGPLIVRGPSLPGRSYTLSAVTVVNTGTEPARYNISFQRVSPGDERPAPSEWLKPGENDFLLAAQQTAEVTVTLDVPRDALPGAYMTNLIATAAPPTQSAGGANLGAAAGTRVIFTVGTPEPGGLFGLTLPETLPDWLLPAFGIAGGGSATLLLLRFLGFGIKLERRP